MAEERNFVVCLRAELKNRGAAIFTGSVPRSCSECGSGVWVSPASERAIVAGAVEPLCNECFDAGGYAVDPEANFGLLSGTLDELWAWLRRN